MRANWLLWLALCVFGGVLLCGPTGSFAQTSGSSSQPSASADRYSRIPGTRVKAGVAGFQTRQQQILSTAGPTVTNTDTGGTLRKTLLVGALQAFFNALQQLIPSLPGIFTGQVLPAVTTAAPTDVTATTATGGGDVASAGNTAVTARGVCWSTSLNPTIEEANGTTLDGTGTGVFTSSITGLTPGTTYHVRAYATNSVGTSYGSDVSFTTAGGTTTGLPTVLTSPGSVIGPVGANSGGNVTSDGGSAVTARGVCWSTSINPTIADSHTTDGSGIGTFASVLTNLTPATTYHVRAYATNANGTSYGEDLTITTTGG